MKFYLHIHLFFLILFIPVTSYCQLKAGATANELQKVLQQVIEDVPKQFSSFKGAVIAENPQTIEYATLLKFTGAEENTIIKYSGNKPIYSWQAVILTTEDYEVAQKKYRQLYQHMKNMHLLMNRDYSFRLVGEYGAPSATMKFSNSIFNLLPQAAEIPKLRVELYMQYVFPEFKVAITVYEKEREDNERGKTNEDIF